MRSLVVLALLATSAYSQERTWTITTEVEAELLAVRGKMAYLKIGDEVKGVPMERLGAADQEYLASLSLAPVMPGPAGEVEQAAAIMPQAAEEMPLPGEPDAPALFPAAGSRLEARPMPAGTYRVDQYGGVLPLRASAPPNYRANNSNNSNQRSTAQSSRNNDDDRPGLFGARARRNDRQRAAASRSR